VRSGKSVANAERVCCSQKRKSGQWKEGRGGPSIAEEVPLEGGESLQGKKPSCYSRHARRERGGEARVWKKHRYSGEFSRSGRAAFWGVKGGKGGEARGRKKNRPLCRWRMKKNFKGRSALARLVGKSSIRRWREAPEEGKRIKGRGEKTPSLHAPRKRGKREEPRGGGGRDRCRGKKTAVGACARRQDQKATRRARKKKDLLSDAHLEKREGTKGGKSKEGKRERLIRTRDYGKGLLVLDVSIWKEKTRRERGKKKDGGETS